MDQLLIAFALSFAAVGLLTYNTLPAEAFSPRRRAHRADASQVSSLLFRLTFPLTDRLIPLFRRLEWAAYRSRMSLQLRRAALGDAIVVDHVFGLKLLSALILPALASRVFVMLTNPALFTAAAIGCFYIPDRLIADLRRNRERAILRALPNAVDVLSLSVEAGLEFLTAIQRVVERGNIGPLQDELATILNDIGLGKPRAEALKSFAQRVEIPEVSSFVSVLVQADMLGASIGPVLQQQAERMRVERFQRAEKAGARATQKILFPLVLCIFPAVLIVIIGPVALQLVHGF